MAVLGTVIFHEHMKSYHYIGMILMIICSFLISFANDSSKKRSFDVLGNEVEKIHPVWAVLMAVLCPLVFAIGNILT